MEDKYLTELVRCLKEDGIKTGKAIGGHLPVLPHGQIVLHIQDSDVFLMAGAVGNQETDELNHNKVSGLAFAVKEYTSAMERAPLLRTRALDPADGYCLLADFNGVVLAGQELEKGWGYQFATLEMGL